MGLGNININNNNTLTIVLFCKNRSSGHFLARAFGAPQWCKWGRHSYLLAWLVRSRLVHSWLGQERSGHVVIFMILKRIRGCFTEWIWLVVYLLSLVEDTLLAWNYRNGKKQTTSSYQTEVTTEMRKTSSLQSAVAHGRTVALSPFITDLTSVSVYLPSPLHLASGLTLGSTFNLFHTSYFIPLGETILEKLKPVFFILRSHFLFCSSICLCCLWT